MYDTFDSLYRVLKFSALPALINQVEAKYAVKMVAQYLRQLFSVCSD